MNVEALAQAAIDEYTGGGFAVQDVCPDPECPAWAVRTKDGDGDVQDFLVPLESRDRPDPDGIEEIEWTTWPPTRAKNVDPFNLGNDDLPAHLL